ncbi:hypothetical protein HUJ04_002426 [Dendroctonus ponderosae]|nr:hypothetical protein HUJ04_002426 [Dendroctonus ponderosae]
MKPTETKPSEDNKETLIKDKDKKENAEKISEGSEEESNKDQSKNKDLIDDKATSNQYIQTTELIKDSDKKEHSEKHSEKIEEQPNKDNSTLKDLIEDNSTSKRQTNEEEKEDIKTIKTKPSEDDDETLMKDSDKKENPGKQQCSVHSDAVLLMDVSLRIDVVMILLTRQFEDTNFLKVHALPHDTINLWKKLFNQLIKIIISNKEKTKNSEKARNAVHPQVKIVNTPPTKQSLYDKLKELEKFLAALFYKRQKLIPLGNLRKRTALCNKILGDLLPCVVLKSSIGRDNERKEEKRYDNKKRPPRKAEQESSKDRTFKNLLEDSATSNLQTSKQKQQNAKSSEAKPSEDNEETVNNDNSKTENTEKQTAETEKDSNKNKNTYKDLLEDISASKYQTNEREREGIQTNKQTKPSEGDEEKLIKDSDKKEISEKQPVETEENVNKDNSTSKNLIEDNSTSNHQPNEREKDEIKTTETKRNENDEETVIKNSDKKEISEKQPVETDENVNKDNSTAKNLIEDSSTSTHQTNERGKKEIETTETKRSEDAEKTVTKDSDKKENIEKQPVETEEKPNQDNSMFKNLIEGCATSNLPTNKQGNEDTKSSETKPGENNEKTAIKDKNKKENTEKLLAEDNRTLKNLIEGNDQTNEREKEDIKSTETKASEANKKTLIKNSNKMKNSEKQSVETGEKPNKDKSTLKNLIEDNSTLTHQTSERGKEEIKTTETNLSEYNEKTIIKGSGKKENNEKQSVETEKESNENKNTYKVVIEDNSTSNHQTKEREKEDIKTAETKPGEDNAKTLIKDRSKNLKSEKQSDLIEENATSDHQTNEREKEDIKTFETKLSEANKKTLKKDEDKKGNSEKLLAEAEEESRKNKSTSKHLIEDSATSNNQLNKSGNIKTTETKASKANGKIFIKNSDQTEKSGKQSAKTEEKSNTDSSLSSSRRDDNATSNRVSKKCEMNNDRKASVLDVKRADAPQQSNNQPFRKQTNVSSLTESVAVSSLHNENTASTSALSKYNSTALNRLDIACINNENKLAEKDISKKHVISKDETSLFLNLTCKLQIITNQISKKLEKVAILDAYTPTGKKNKLLAKLIRQSTIILESNEQTMLSFTSTLDRQMRTAENDLKVFIEMIANGRAKNTSNASRSYSGKTQKAQTAQGPFDKLEELQQLFATLFTKKNKLKPLEWRERIIITGNILDYFIPCLVSMLLNQYQTKDNKRDNHQSKAREGQDITTAGTQPNEDDADTLIEDSKGNSASKDLIEDNATSNIMSKKDTINNDEKASTLNAERAQPQSFLGESISVSCLKDANSVSTSLENNEAQAQGTDSQENQTKKLKIRNVTLCHEDLDEDPDSQMLRIFENETIPTELESVEEESEIDQLRNNSSDDNSDDQDEPLFKLSETLPELYGTEISTSQEVFDDNIDKEITDTKNKDTEKQLGENKAHSDIYQSILQIVNSHEVEIVTSEQGVQNTHFNNDDELLNLTKQPNDENVIPMLLSFEDISKALKNSQRKRAKIAYLLDNLCEALKRPSNAEETMSQAISIFTESNSATEPLPTNELESSQLLQPQASEDIQPKEPKDDIAMQLISNQTLHSQIEADLDNMTFTPEASAITFRQKYEYDPDNQIEKTEATESISDDTLVENDQEEILEQETKILCDEMICESLAKLLEILFMNIERNQNTISLIRLLASKMIRVQETISQCISSDEMLMSVIIRKKMRTSRISYKSKIEYIKDIIQVPNIKHLIGKEKEESLSVELENRSCQSSGFLAILENVVCKIVDVQKSDKAIDNIKTRIKLNKTIINFLISTYSQLLGQDIPKPEKCLNYETSSTELIKRESADYLGKNDLKVTEETPSNQQLDETTEKIHQQKPETVGESNEEVERIKLPQCIESSIQIIVPQALQALTEADLDSVKMTSEASDINRNADEEHQREQHENDLLLVLKCDQNNEEAEEACEEINAPNELASIETLQVPTEADSDSVKMTSEASDINRNADEEHQREQHENDLLLVLKCDQNNEEAEEACEEINAPNELASIETLQVPTEADPGSVELTSEASDINRNADEEKQREQHENDLLLQLECDQNNKKEKSELLEEKNTLNKPASSETLQAPTGENTDRMKLTQKTADINSGENEDKRSEKPENEAAVELERDQDDEAHTIEKCEDKLVSTVHVQRQDNEYIQFKELKNTPTKSVDFAVQLSSNETLQVQTGTDLDNIAGTLRASNVNKREDKKKQSSGEEKGACCQDKDTGKTKEVANTKPDMGRKSPTISNDFSEVKDRDDLNGDETESEVSTNEWMYQDLETLFKKIIVMIKSNPHTVSRLTDVISNLISGHEAINLQSSHEYNVIENDNTYANIINDLLFLDCEFGNQKEESVLIAPEDRNLAILEYFVFQLFRAQKLAKSPATLKLHARLYISIIDIILAFLQDIPKPEQWHKSQTPSSEVQLSSNETLLVHTGTDLDNIAWTHKASNVNKREDKKKQSSGEEKGACCQDKDTGKTKEIANVNMGRKSPAVSSDSSDVKDGDEMIETESEVPSNEMVYEAMEKLLKPLIMGIESNPYAISRLEGVISIIESAHERINSRSSDAYNVMDCEDIRSVLTNLIMTIEDKCSKENWERFSRLNTDLAILEHTVFLLIDTQDLANSPETLKLHARLYVALIAFIRAFLQDVPNPEECQKSESPSSEVTKGESAEYLKENEWKVTEEGASNELLEKRQEKIHQQKPEVIGQTKDEVENINPSHMECLESSTEIIVPPSSSGADPNSIKLTPKLLDIDREQDEEKLEVHVPLDLECDQSNAKEKTGRYEEKSEINEPPREDPKRIKLTQKTSDISSGESEEKRSEKHENEAAIKLECDQDDEADTTEKCEDKLVSTAQVPRQGNEDNHSKELKNAPTNNVDFAVQLSSNETLQVQTGTDLDNIAWTPRASNVDEQKPEVIGQTNDEVEKINPPHMECLESSTEITVPPSIKAATNNKEKSAKVKHKFSDDLDNLAIPPVPAESNELLMDNTSDNDAWQSLSSRLTQALAEDDVQYSAAPKQHRTENWEDKAEVFPQHLKAIEANKIEFETSTYLLSAEAQCVATMLDDSKCKNGFDLLLGSYIEHDEENMSNLNTRLCDINVGENYRHLTRDNLHESIDLGIDNNGDLKEAEISGNKFNGSSKEPANDLHQDLSTLPLNKTDNLGNLKKVEAQDASQKGADAVAGKCGESGPAGKPKKLSKQHMRSMEKCARYVYDVSLRSEQESDHDNDGAIPILDKDSLAIVTESKISPEDNLVIDPMMCNADIFRDDKHFYKLYARIPNNTYNDNISSMWMSTIKGYKTLDDLLQLHQIGQITSRILSTEHSDHFVFSCLKQQIEPIKNFPRQSGIKEYDCIDLQAALELCNKNLHEIKQDIDE